MKVGIIGLGYVGGSVRGWFQKKNGQRDLFLFDKYKKIGSLEEVNKADVIFIAVPTPFVKGKGYDDSAVQESIRNVKDGKIIVIKSTIMPGSVAKFQKKFSKKTILFNPEFLRAKTALQDFLKPDRQIVGYANAKGKAAAKKVMSLLPRASYEKIMGSTEAEMVKYFGNAFLATRVIFANQIYDICKAAGIDYDEVREGASHDPRVGPSHLNIFFKDVADPQGKKRGYGGLCLPKDVKALMQFGKSVGSETDLLETLEKANKKLGR